MPVSGTPVERLAQAVFRIEKSTGIGPKAEFQKKDLGPAMLSASGNEEEEYPSVLAFDKFLNTLVRQYLDLSNALGGVVAVDMPRLNYFKSSFKGHAQKIVQCFTCMVVSA